MSTSQNGWPAYTDGRHDDLVAIPHVAGRVRRGDVATIFTHLIDRFDREVEPVGEAAGQPEDDWGWASRPIRGKTTDLSNHASGTAIDLNAPRHPLGAVGTFTPAQVAVIRDILRDVSPAVRWGGDYSGRKDEMHFEINTTPAQVAAVAARLRGGTAGGGQSAARPTTIHVPTQEEAMLLISDAYKKDGVIAVLALNGSWTELRNQGEVNNLAKVLGPVTPVTDTTLRELVSEGRGAYKTVRVRS